MRSRKRERETGREVASKWLRKATRTDERGAAGRATNRRRTTRLGYVGGAVIQPNAQVCRRLAGASQECRPPAPAPPSRQPATRSGWVPPALLLLLLRRLSSLSLSLFCSLPSPLALSPSCPARPSLPHLPIRFSRYPTPYGSHRARCCDLVVVSTTTIANYGTQAQVRARV